MSVRARWEYAPQTRQWVLAVWSTGGEPVEVFGAVCADELRAAPPRVRAAVAQAMLGAHGVVPPARVFDGPPGEQQSMTCGLCWQVSWNANDARERYCGACRVFPEDGVLAPVVLPPAAVTVASSQVRG